MGFFFDRQGLETEKAELEIHLAYYSFFFSKLATII